MAKDKKPFTGTNFQGFCILNGEKPPALWTNELFTTREAGEAYIRERHRAYGWDLSKHQVVPCQIAIRVIEYETQTEASV